MENVSWQEHRLLILNELKRMGDKIENLERAVIALQLNAAKWGGIFGLLGAATTLIVEHTFKSLKG